MATELNFLSYSLKIFSSGTTGQILKGGGGYLHYTDMKKSLNKRAMMALYHSTG